MKAVELRSGEGPVVHFFSGAGGSAGELAAVAAALHGDPRVVALVPVAGAAAAGSVAAMAAEAAARVRSAQPGGPYRLLGYSFGGLLALEVSQMLEDAGEEVAFVGLVDSFYAQRFWPTALFLRSIARRAPVHVQAMLRHSPAEAAREVQLRLARLGRRLRQRYAPGDPQPRVTASVQDDNIAVMNRWEPRRFPAAVTLFTATGADFGCDLAELWRPWLPDLVVRRIPGDHLGLVHSHEGVSRLASELDRALHLVTVPLKVLIASTFRWPSAARLAVDFREVGWAVEAVAPRGSAVHALAALDRGHLLGPFAPVSSLTRAIEASQPDLVVPMDDRTRHALALVHARSNPRTAAGARIRRLLERSLGSSGKSSLVYSRAALMAAATAAGVPCPPTSVVRSSADVSAWLRHHAGPAVLKTDGSWGGRGVAIVSTDKEVDRAWRLMSRPTPLHRALKRLIVEADPWPLRDRISRATPIVSMQPFVEGKPANAAVACWGGNALGQVQAEVIESDGQKGPSTVIRLIDNPDITYAVKSVVGSLRLSGLCGLDFIIDDRGRAYLLELNPRATPTAHLIGADGSDPLTCLRAAMGRELPLARRPRHPGDLVALFPQEQSRDPSSPHLRSGYHDVPYHAPDLVNWVLSDLEDGSRLLRTLHGRRWGRMKSRRTHFWRPWCRPSAMSSASKDADAIARTCPPGGSS